MFLKQQYLITHNRRKICRRGLSLYKPLFTASIQQAVINIEQYLIKVTDIWVILVAFRTLLIFMWLRVRHCIFSVENKQTQSPLCSTIQNILKVHPFPLLLQSKGSQKPSHFLSCRTENIYVLQNRILPTKGRGKASSDCIGTNSFNKPVYLLNPSSWKYSLYNQSSNANRQVQLGLAYWKMLCHKSGQLAKQSHYLICVEE